MFSRDMKFLFHGFIRKVGQLQGLHMCLHHVQPTLDARCGPLLASQRLHCSYAQNPQPEHTCLRGIAGTASPPLWTWRLQGTAFLPSLHSKACSQPLRTFQASCCHTSLELPNAGSD